MRLEDLFNADAVHPVDVLGVTVYVRPLSAAAGLRMHAAKSDAALAEEAIGASVCDETGRLLYTDKRARARLLDQLPIQAVERLMAHITRINGLADAGDADTPLSSTC